MALRGLKFLKLVRSANIVRHNVMCTSVVLPYVAKSSKEFQTEDKFVYLEDPDTFGTLSGRPTNHNEVFEDDGDIKEKEFLENLPLPHQKLTIKQYSDLIKQYLNHKRLKEAINVLEVRMLKQDRVKPSNYIYNILIGACAEVGYTRKAFKLYNDMKRRALQVTGDTYTCLFEACTNSPWAIDGLKNATHLRNLMIEKGIEPNLTNYNAMIKAFGRCGDLPTAFKIVDEMISKKIKIRVHTFNHLIQACITDKDTGLRHALVVWRKMLKIREKPNIYSFNLMLKCVNECNLGSKEDIEELIRIIQNESPLTIEKQSKVKMLEIESSRNLLNTAPTQENTELQHKNSTSLILIGESALQNRAHRNDSEVEYNEIIKNRTIPSSNALTTNNLETVSLQFVQKLPAIKTDERIVPNLLSKKIKMDQVFSLQEVQTAQDKFNIVGGQEDFLKEMEAYSVKPDIKTFTQMLMLIDNSIEAENKMIETMNALEIKADIDFYNMLIKKRCLRSDYDNAVAVKEMVEKEDKHRKRKYPLKKKWRLKPNVMTYGVLAMACRTKESAEQLLNEMKEKQLKVNAHILGTLLRHGTAHNQFDYIVYIMNIVKEEKLQINSIFLKHLEAFNDKCAYFVKGVRGKNFQQNNSDEFKKAHQRFLSFYTKWLKEMNIEDVLKPEHPWQQFREEYPETFQRPDIKIVEPKRFYKGNRKFVNYTPRL